MKISSKLIRIAILFFICVQYSHFYAQPRSMTIVTSPSWLVAGSTNLNAVAAIPTIFVNGAIQSWVTTNLGIPSNGLIWSTRDFPGLGFCCDSYNFVDTFYIPCNACIDSARYWIEADDTMALNLNQTLIATSTPGWINVKTGIITTSLFNTTTNSGRNSLLAFGKDMARGPRYIAMRMRIYYRLCDE